MKKKQLNQRVEIIVDLVQSKVSDPLKHHIKSFTQQFFATLASDDMRKIPLENLAAGVLDLWEFFQERKAGKPKIRIYYWKPDVTLPLSLAERIVIDIINDDMSFLVDSLIQLLQKHDLKAKRIVHPVIKVQRTPDGKLNEVFELTQETAETQYESVIHCEIVEAISPELVDILATDLQSVLQDVRFATSDWKKMLDKVLVAKEHLKETCPQEYAEHQAEMIHFLEWIREDHYTFLGYAYYDFSKTSNNEGVKISCLHGLGIMKLEPYQNLAKIFDGVDFTTQTLQYILEPTPLFVNKASQTSQVHRGVTMDVIGVKHFSPDGTVIGMHLFMGLFTSVAYDSSVRDIPLLRRKLDRILEYTGLIPNWHDGKSLIHILDSLPRDDFFQADIEKLAEIGLAVLNLQERQRFALFIHQDQFNRFLSCLVYIPRERFDSELCDLIGETLAQDLKGILSVYKAQFGSFALARVHYTIDIPGGIKDVYSVNALEQKIVKVARSWNDDLRLTLVSAFNDHEGQQFYKRYRQAFTKGYQERFQGMEVKADIEQIELVYQSNSPKARIYTLEEGPSNCLRLKIFNPSEPVALSDILPVLENLDLRIIKEIPFLVKPKGSHTPVWIHDFEMLTRDGYVVNSAEIRDNFFAALKAIKAKVIEDDSLNRLVLRANLMPREVLILRILTKYLRQLQFSFSREYIEQTLLKYSDITKQLVTFFRSKFDPSIALDDAFLKQEILQNIDHIQNSDEDKILRRFFNLIQAALRTNFYQKDEQENFKTYTSIKFDCQQIEELPLPKPKYEIYVYSSRFEAIHLRGGKVARGGIRWSDRLEDYRTEILGLLKAQMVKNTVIVPVGSKGGFVLKAIPQNASRAELLNEAIVCYKTMIQGLLDITDNFKNGQVIPPKDVVRWDDNDPYLVVAADKGTATFSDHANAVSKAYNFWLDDAFASGGSSGYDHKKIGITARGAWESVKRHFYELDFSIENTPFTVVGVGDMSGDVFGNGMLQFDTIKLVAAFNHHHIFIDPNPDPKLSYAERKRLFSLPSSTWKDYDPAFISKGGGVFEKTAKMISLSPEIQQLFNFNVAEITPNELIKAILKLKVDLLWFGGIGTFIKSSKENHQDVGDRTNDNVRVNAKELRCKVIGEGANLGVTQLGRIEYANCGGRLNTDAIDNSGGVNCSDHEVNIKILLNRMVLAGNLTLVDRNKLLESMTNDIAKLVLRDNYKQAQAISLLEAQGPNLLDGQIRIMRTLEAKGILNRTLEYLPDDATMLEYQTLQKGLTKPEIAILLAYSKIDFYQEILTSSLLDDFVFEEDLLNYFPENMRKSYRAEILVHPLRREIIATKITNEIVNRISASFIYDTMAKLNCSLEDVFKAYILIRNVFDLRTLWRQLESLDKQIHPSTLLKVMIDILHMVRRTIKWLIRHYKMQDNITASTHLFKLGTNAFLSDLETFLDEQSQQNRQQQIALYENLGLPQKLALEISHIQVATSSPDIILIASQTGYSIAQIATIYFLVGARLGITRLRQAIEKIKSNTSWHRLAILGIQEDLFNIQNEVVIQVLQFDENHDPQDPRLKVQKLLELWAKASQDKLLSLDSLLQEAFLQNSFDLANLSVVTRELRNLITELVISQKPD
ncbi:MAG: hypothetical protein BGO77_04670 [Caedibacter sp. 37-49]|nr:MAG: hypothetical protein BGO77_04670 [Caedibacter sp. 37-49]